MIVKNRYKDDFEAQAHNAISLSKSEQERIQKDRLDVINQVEKDAISPAARKLLEENRQKLVEKQKSEKLSKKNMEIYINLEKETPQDSDMPNVEKRVIKLNSNIPEDEDFGL